MVRQSRSKDKGEDKGATPNREELLQLAIQSARQGNRQGARVMFQQVLHQDPRNERALMWMAYMGRSKTEKRKYLTMAVKVNAKNKRAVELLRQMQHAEEARTNRALIYGGLFIGGLVLVVAVIVLVVILLSGGA